MEQTLASILIGIMGVGGLLMFIVLMGCIIFYKDDYWN